jgi:hypothetical protein
VVTTGQTVAKGVKDKEWDRKAWRRKEPIAYRSLNAVSGSSIVTYLSYSSSASGCNTSKRANITTLKKVRTFYFDYQTPCIDYISTRP